MSIDTARRVGGILIAVGGLLFLGLSSPVDDRFREGVRAYQEGEYARAQKLFQDLLQENPAYVDERYGAGAFWLGKVYKASAETDSMRWAWRKGVEALTEANRFDVRLFDAYLWASWSNPRSERKESIDAYVSLLGSVGTDVNAEEHDILLRHVAQLLPLLDERQYSRFVEEGSLSEPESWTFRKSAGEWLQSWWIRQDPLPATASNERLLEHLERVKEARAKFKYVKRPAGWDERGDLYVRYGPPNRRDSISFNSARFHREVIRFGVGVHRGDFPDNEIWSYPHVGSRGHFLFIREDEAYRLGKTLDLIPTKLKRNFHSGDRSQNQAYSSLAALRYVYERLAMYYTDAGNVYQNIEAYFTNQEILKDVFGSTSSVGRGSGERSMYRGPGASSSQPSVVASEAILKSRHQQRVFVRKREREMPAQYSESTTAKTVLPIETRVARFLTNEGSTRAEVYWGGNLSGGEFEVSQQVVNVSLVQYGAGYERQKTTSNQYAFHVESKGGKTRRIAPSVLNTTGTTDPFHLALQWDRYEARSGGDETQVGERTGRQTMRIDTLHALTSDPSRLEMSDIRPMVASDRGQLNYARPIEGSTPYPFRTLSVEAPLLLYFEVYHLEFGSQDRTRYEVSYEVRREVNESSFLGLFGGDEVERTETSSSYTGTDRTVTEAIRLDWGDANPEKQQPTTVTIRVKDQVTGQEVERTIHFQLVPSR